MAGMKVDFNALRIRTCDEFDRLVKVIRAEVPNPSNRLARAVNDLRSSVAGIGLCYDEHGSEDILGERELEFLEEED